MLVIGRPRSLLLLAKYLAPDIEFKTRPFVFVYPIRGKPLTGAKFRKSGIAAISLEVGGGDGTKTGKAHIAAVVMTK